MSVWLIENNWCQQPWELLESNICLLLNSNIKPWAHANLRCKHEGADLLYIKNSEEQRIITSIDLKETFLFRLIIEIKNFCIFFFVAV